MSNYKSIFFYYLKKKSKEQFFNLDKIYCQFLRKQAINKADFEFK